MHRFVYLLGLVALLVASACARAVTFVDQEDDPELSFTHEALEHTLVRPGWYHKVKDLFSFRGGSIIFVSQEYMDEADAEKEDLETEEAGITEMVNDDLIPLSGNDNAHISGFAEDAVFNHNKYRAKHGVGNLVWDNALAQYALNYGKKCQWKHSGGPYGENLFAAKPSGDITRAVQAWYGEEKLYNYNNPNWQPGAGHFTQVVWKGSTRVGCASVQCGNIGTYVICEYAPPGNVIGHFKENVFPPRR